MARNDDENEIEKLDEIPALARELKASYPEAHEILIEAARAIAGDELHDIRRASLARRLRATCSGGAGELVDALAHLLANGVQL